MARIDYPNLSTVDGAQRLIEKIVTERGSVLHLYHMLMHSLPVAEGWLDYLTSIRQRTRLDGFLREMVILRIAHLNRAQYEADQHGPIALREGLSQAQLEALRGEWLDPKLFNACQRCVLAYTDAMTLSVQVPDHIFDSLRQHLTERDVVELTAIVAAYNMVSRFLEALEISSADSHLNRSGFRTG